MRLRVSPQAQGSGWGETSYLDSTGMRETFLPLRGPPGVSQAPLWPGQTLLGPTGHLRGPKEGQCTVQSYPTFQVLKGGWGGPLRLPCQGAGKIREGALQRKKLTLKYSSQGEREGKRETMPCTQEGIDKIGRAHV